MELINKEILDTNDSQYIEHKIHMKLYDIEQQDVYEIGRELTQWGINCINVNFDFSKKPYEGYFVYNFSLLHTKELPLRDKLMNSAWVLEHYRKALLSPCSTVARQFTKTRKCIAKGCMIIEGKKVELPPQPLPEKPDKINNTNETHTKIISGHNIDKNNSRILIYNKKLKKNQIVNLKEIDEELNSIRNKLEVEIEINTYEDSENKVTHTSQKSVLIPILILEIEAIIDDFILREEFSKYLKKNERAFSMLKKFIGDIGI